MLITLAIAFTASKQLPAHVGGSSERTTLRVIGLGDSVPAATACACTSYVALVGQHLAALERRPSSTENLAQPGLTSSGLLQQLADPAVRADVGRAALVIVTIGANDFDPSRLTSSDCLLDLIQSCYADTFGDLRQHLTELLTQVHSLQPASGRILVTGYWNDFLDGVIGRHKGAQYVTASNEVTLASNAVTAMISSATGAQYVDIYAAFKGSDGAKDCTELLAADGDHPNAAGHRLIARTLEQALLQPTSPPARSNSRNLRSVQLIKVP